MLYSEGIGIPKHSIHLAWLIPTSKCRALLRKDEDWERRYKKMKTLMDWMYAGQQLFVWLENPV